MLLGKPGACSLGALYLLGSTLVQALLLWRCPLGSWPRFSFLLMCVWEYSSQLLTWISSYLAFTGELSFPLFYMDTYMWFYNKYGRFFSFSSFLSLALSLLSGHPFLSPKLITQYVPPPLFSLCCILIYKHVCPYIYFHYFCVIFNPLFCMFLVWHEFPGVLMLASPNLFSPWCGLFLYLFFPQIFCFKFCTTHCRYKDELDTDPDLRELQVRVLGAVREGSGGPDKGHVDQPGGRALLIPPGSLLL